MELFVLAASKSNIASRGEYTWLETGWGDFGYKISSANWACHKNKTERNFLYTTEKPVYLKDDGSYSHLDLEAGLKENLSKIQNNFCGIEFTIGEDGFKLVASSGRYSRPRMYFTVQPSGVYFSHDLRQLLPFSSKKLNSSVAYSIMKYGSPPEYLSIIEDIYEIPASQYIELDQPAYDRAILAREIPLSDFQYYFKVKFPMDGGNIDKTAEMLSKQYEFLAQQNFLVPVSGGVDSSLINFMMNEHAQTEYPAFMLQFGGDDREVDFARKAVRDTKANLDVITLEPTDLIRAFEIQTERLMYPCGETGPLSYGHLMAQEIFKGYYFIDGSLADGCYGSRNYNIPLFEGYKNYPNFMLKWNERIAAYMQFNEMKGHERFTPRDSLVKDPYLHFMNMYLGPFINTWVKGAEKYSREILPYWEHYYQLIDEPYREDSWARYTIFKQVSYIGKTSCARALDISQPENSTVTNFMWLETLEDQGHYTWAEKTIDNIKKYPLKKILERYIDKDFIYRHKVGLNSSFEDWISVGTNSEYFANILRTQGGIVDHFLGRSKKQALIKELEKDAMHPNVARLIISICSMEAWIKQNKVVL